jgi:hypothetical protein
MHAAAISNRIKFSPTILLPVKALNLNVASIQAIEKMADVLWHKADKRQRPFNVPFLVEWTVAGSRVAIG